MRLLAALLTAALTLPAAAQVKVERGTDDPSSVSWGPDPKAAVEKVFKRLLEHSGYDAPAWLKKENRGPTQLVYVDKHHAIEGSPAVALAAGVGPNKQHHAVVAATYGLLDIVRTDDEMAAILGHEVSHLVLEHPQKMLAERMKAFDEWSARQDWDAFPSNDAALSAFTREHKGRFEKTQRALEAEADQYGQELAGLAGYDMKAAGEAMLHAKDWLWAMDAAETPTHDPLKERAARLKRMAAQHEALSPARTAQLARLGRWGSRTAPPFRPSPAGGQASAGNGDCVIGWGTAIAISDYP
ncbi:MAG: M48 family metalloprotease [Elusimicrobia bacterium]|nr:M48 family metalloprotease [Elusimicrobiota bacterium]